MIRVTNKGDFTKFNRYCEKILNIVHKGSLDKYGEEGVAALKASTPVRTGKTAGSWYYEIQRFSDGDIKIEWKNSNIEDYCNIAILIQYGHATGNGSYIQGIDYINPAMRPIFEKIAYDIWKEVKSV